MIQTDPIAFSPSIPLDSTEKLWEWHIPSDRLFFSKGTRLAFGLSDGGSPATMAAFFEHIPEGCLQSLCELREGVIGGDRGFLETAYPVENFFVRERLFVLERDAEGRAIRMGWLDRLDVLRWMEVANALFGGNTQIVLYGVSMGAATTMIAAAEESLPACVRCAVEDCGYFNPGYLCRFLGEAVPTAALSALPSIGPLVPDPLRMEFRKGFSARCRAPMQVAYVVHSRRQGLGRPCGNGSPAVRSENRRQGTLDTFRRRSWCRLSPRSADICAARPHIRGALVRMPRHP